MAASNVFMCETISEDKLIAIWEEFPCLYDVRSELFRNRDLRGQAILKIADEVEQSADWVKNKIRELRNSYCKARKMGSSGRRRKQVTKRTAWLQERLEFLAPFLGKRDTVCNLNDSSSTLSQDSLDAGEEVGEVSVKEEEGVVVEEAVTTSSTSTQMPLKQTTKTLKQKRDEEQSLPVLGLVESMVERNDSKRQRLSGECASYGTYVGECLEKLDLRTRCIAQHQISNVLFQAQMGTLVHPVPQSQVFPSLITHTQSSASPTQQM